MRLALVPRTSEFYDLFTQAAENALRAAQLAEDRFRDFPSAAVSQADVKAVETRGDEITRDLVQLLNTQYVTPFDREDIFQLATAMDDVVDHIEEACNLLELYGVEQPAKPALEQCRIIVESVGHLATAVSGLKGMNGVQQAIVAVKGKEDEGDRVVREAIGALFHEARIDPLVVIRWKDIYEALEDAIDACETAANVVGNIVVKNA